ncbi:MAG: hypothetical protein ACJAR0_004827 [Candidatus Azotimanducaceae bacterium]
MNALSANTTVNRQMSVARREQATNADHMVCLHLLTQCRLKTHLL